MESEAVSDCLRDRHSAVGSHAHSEVFYLHARSTAFA
jgi:hypothetical protein